MTASRWDRAGSLPVPVRGRPRPELASLPPDDLPTLGQIFTFMRTELAAGATGELFVYTVDTEQGPVELAMYVECRPLAGGDASLGIALVTVPEAYEVAAPEFERVLSGISTGTEA